MTPPKVPPKKETAADLFGEPPSADGEDETADATDATEDAEA